MKLWSRIGYRFRKLFKKKEPTSRTVPISGKRSLSWHLHYRVSIDSLADSLSIDLLINWPWFDMMHLGTPLKPYPYPPNTVKNQKYNILTFLPLVLFEQVSKLSVMSVVAFILVHRSMYTCITLWIQLVSILFQCLFLACLYLAIFWRLSSWLSVYLLFSSALCAFHYHVQGGIWWHQALQSW